MPKTNIEWEIVKLVRIARINGGKTQRNIAKLLDVSAGFIGQIETESNSSMYGYHQLNAIAKDLNCSLKDFMPEHPI